MKHFALILGALALTGAPAFAQTSHDSSTKPAAAAVKQQAGKPAVSPMLARQNKEASKPKKKHARLQTPTKASH
jgi:hypothetical protein